MVGRSKRQNRRRRWALALLLLLLCATLAWQGLEYLVDIDRHRPRIEAELEALFGRPVSVGEMDLQLFPTPHLYAKEVTIGQGDCRLYALGVHAYARPGALLRGEVALSSVTATGAVLTVPRGAGAIRGEWKAFRAHLRSRRERAAALRQAGGTSPVLKLRVEEIRTARLKVLRGGVPWLEGHVHVHDVLSPRKSARISMALPILEPACKVFGTVVLDEEAPHAERWHGELTFRGIDARRLLRRDRDPHLRFDVEVGFSGEPPFAVTAKFTGQAEEVPFTAEASADIWIQDARMAVNDLAFGTGASSLSADMTYTYGQGLAMELHDAQIRGWPLAALFGWLAPPDSPISPAEDTQVNLEGLLMGVDAQGLARIVRGEGRFERLSLDRLPIGPLSGAFSVSENAFQFDRVDGQGFEASGMLRPDFATQDIAFDLAGTGDLAALLGEASPPPPWLEVRGGRVRIDSASGNIRPGETWPAGLNAQGRIEGGRFSLRGPVFQETLADVALSFSAVEGTIEARGSTATTRHGTLQWDGHYDPTATAINGNLVLDMASLGRAHLPSTAAGRVAQRVLDGFGTSAWAVNATFPQDDSSMAILRATRPADPPASLSATVLWGEVPVLSALELDVAIPIPDVTELLPAQAQAEGVVGLHVERPSTGKDFAALADFTQSTLRLGPYVEKAAGHPAALEIFGDASSFPWQLGHVRARCMGAQVDLKPVEGGVLCDRFDVDLAPLAVLLPEGASAAGQVSGSFDTALPTGDLVFSEASMAIAPELGVDTLDGRVHYAEGHWRCEKLRIVGAQSDCTIDAGRDPATGRWGATINGPKINANGLIVMFGAARLFAQKRKAETPLDGVGTIQGDVAVAADELRFRRGTVHDVHAQMRLAEEAIHFEEMRFRVGQGTAEGSAVYTYALGAKPATISMGLQFDAADITVLEGLSLGAPQDLQGTTTGSVNLQFPVGMGHEVYKTMSGAVKLSAAKGTYGKLGWATTLLTALKTTEIFRLRLPSLRDRGLTYDRSTLTLEITDGVVRVEDFTVTEKSYEVKAQGLIDFPEDRSKIGIRVNVLESVTGLLDAVPGLRLGARLIELGTTVRLVATGSPFDLDIRARSAPAGRNE